MMQTPTWVSGIQLGRSTFCSAALDRQINPQPARNSRLMNKSARSLVSSPPTASLSWTLPAGMGAAFPAGLGHSGAGGEQLKRDARLQWWWGLGVLFLAMPPTRQMTEWVSLYFCSCGPRLLALLWRGRQNSSGCLCHFETAKETH